MRLCTSLTELSLVSSHPSLPYPPGCEEAWALFAFLAGEPIALRLTRGVSGPPLRIGEGTASPALPLRTLSVAGVDVGGIGTERALGYLVRLTTLERLDITGTENADAAVRIDDALRLFVLLPRLRQLRCVTSDAAYGDATAAAQTLPSPWPPVCVERKLVLPTTPVLHMGRHDPAPRPWCIMTLVMQRQVS